MSVFSGLLPLLLALSSSGAIAEKALPFSAWSWVKPPFQGFADSDFGLSAAMSSDFVAVGAPAPMMQFNHSNGAVYLFKINATSNNRRDMFTLQTVLVPPVSLRLPPAFEPNGPPQHMLFGHVLQFFGRGKWLAVVAPSDFSCEPITNPVNVSCSGRPSVYVYAYDSARQLWELKQVLLDPRNKQAQQTFSSSRFGWSLGGSDDRIAIGSDDPTCATGIYTDESSLPVTPLCQGNFGVFVYRLNASATSLPLSFESFIKSPRTTPFQNFGIKVSLLGPRLLVGADSDRSCQTGVIAPATLTHPNPGCSASGAVHSFLFSEATKTWQADVVVKPPPQVLTTGDQFGYAIAQLSAEYVVISSPRDKSCFQGDSSDGCPSAGAVYLYFVSPNGTWSLRQQLKADEAANRAGASQFGLLLTAPSSSSLVVGSPRAPFCFFNSTNNTRWCSRNTSPSAFPFSFNGTLTPWFLDGDSYRPSSTSSSIYRYEALVSNTDLFALSLPELATCSMDDSLLDSCWGGGGIVAFRTEPPRASPTVENGLLLNPHPPMPNRVVWGYDSTTVVSGDYVAITAPYEGGCDLGATREGPTRFLGCESSGALYIYRRSNAGSRLAGFSSDAYIKLERLRVGTKLLGASAAMSPNRVVTASLFGCKIPAPNCKPEYTDVVFVFDRDKDGNPGDGSAGIGAGSWSLTGEITSNRTTAGPHYVLGLAISQSGKVIVAGFPGDSSCATGVNPLITNDTRCVSSGGVEIFVQGPTGIWASTTFIKPESPSWSLEFGSPGRLDVSADGRVVVVGAPNDQACTSSNLSGTGCPALGAVFVYRCAGVCDSAATSTWSLQAVLKPPTWVGRTNVQFGYKLVLSGQTRLSLAVSAIGEVSNASGINGVRFNSSSGALSSGVVLLYSLKASTDLWDLDYDVKPDFSGNLTEAGVDSFGSGLGYWEGSDTADSSVVARLLVGSMYSWGCYNMSVPNVEGKVAPAKIIDWISCTGGVVFMYERFANNTWRTTALANPVNDRSFLFEGYGSRIGVSGTVVSVLTRGDANCGTKFNDFQAFEASCPDSGAATFYGSFVPPVGSVGIGNAPVVAPIGASSSTRTDDSTMLVIIVAVVVGVLLIAALVAIIVRRRANRRGSDSTALELSGHYVKFSSSVADDENTTYHNVKSVSSHKKDGNTTPGVDYHNVREVIGVDYHNVREVIPAAGPEGR